mgnify:CR=1 FL=1
MVEILDSGIWVQHLGGGLEIGLRYAVLALGLSLIFNTLGVFNVAHGATYMLGAYAAGLVAERFGFWPGLVVSPVLVGLLGLAIEALVLRRIYRGLPQLGLLFTFGLAVFLEQAIRIFVPPLPQPTAAPPVLSGSLAVGPFVYSKFGSFTIAASIAILGFLWWFLEMTSHGRVVRAAGRDPEMVRLLGLSVRPVLTAVFVLGIALAALAGALAAPSSPLDPAMGNAALAAAFAAVVIGGLGSIWGAVLSGLLVGLVMGVATAFWPQASEASLYLLLLLVLMLPPQGTVRRAALAAVRAVGR